MKLDEWLKQKVKEKEMTQKELAEYLGVTPSAVSRYLSGQSEPAFRHLKKLAKLFDTPEDELIAMKTSTLAERATKLIERDELEAELRELAKSFDRVLFDQFVDATGQLDEDAMRDVIKFMRFIIEKEREEKEEKK